jgi:hypothetical protein
MAFTLKVCAPSAISVYDMGVVQDEYALPSIEHWNVAFVSAEVKLKDAVVLFVGFEGLAVIVVFGGVRSTVHE